MSSLILKPSENLADPSWANRHTMDWDLRKIYLKTKNCSDSTSLALGCAVSSKLNISRFEASSVQNGVHQMLLCTTLPEAWGTQDIDFNSLSRLIITNWFPSEIWLKLGPQLLKKCCTYRPLWTFIQLLESLYISGYPPTPGSQRLPLERSWNFFWRSFNLIKLRKKHAQETLCQYLGK